MSNDVEKVNQNMRKKKKKRQKIMEMNKKGLIQKKEWQNMIKTK